MQYPCPPSFATWLTLEDAAAHESSSSPSPVPKDESAVIRNHHAASSSSSPQSTLPSLRSLVRHSDECRALEKAVEMGQTLDEYLLALEAAMDRGSVIQRAAWMEEKEKKQWKDATRTNTINRHRSSSPMPETVLDAIAKVSTKDGAHSTLFSSHHHQISECFSNLTSALHTISSEVLPRLEEARRFNERMGEELEMQLAMQQPLPQPQQQNSCNANVSAHSTTNPSSSTPFAPLDPLRLVAWNKLRLARAEQSLLHRASSLLSATLTPDNEQAYRERHEALERERKRKYERWAQQQNKTKPWRRAMYSPTCDRSEVPISSSTRHSTAASAAAAAASSTNVVATPAPPPELNTDMTDAGLAMANGSKPSTPDSEIPYSPAFPCSSSSPPSSPGYSTGEPDGISSSNWDPSMDYDENMRRCYSPTAPSDAPHRHHHHHHQETHQRSDRSRRKTDTLNAFTTTTAVATATAAASHPHQDTNMVDADADADGDAVEHPNSHSLSSHTPSDGTPPLAQEHHPRNSQQEQQHERSTALTPLSTPQPRPRTRTIDSSQVRSGANQLYLMPSIAPTPVSAPQGQDQSAASFLRARLDTPLHVGTPATKSVTRTSSPDIAHALTFGSSQSLSQSQSQRQQIGAMRNSKVITTPHAAPQTAESACSSQPRDSNRGKFRSPPTVPSPVPMEVSGETPAPPSSGQLPPSSTSSPSLSHPITRSAEKSSPPSQHHHHQASLSLGLSTSQRQSQSPEKLKTPDHDKQKEGQGQGQVQAPAQRQHTSEVDDAAADANSATNSANGKMAAASTSSEDAHAESSAANGTNTCVDTSGPDEANPMQDQESEWRAAPSLSSQPEPSLENGNASPSSSSSDENANEPSFPLTAPTPAAKTKSHTQQTVHQRPVAEGGAHPPVPSASLPVRVDARGMDMVSPSQLASDSPNQHQHQLQRQRQRQRQRPDHMHVSPARAMSSINPSSTPGPWLQRKRKRGTELSQHESGMTAADSADPTHATDTVTVAHDSLKP